MRPSTVAAVLIGALPPLFLYGIAAHYRSEAEDYRAELAQARRVADRRGALLKDASAAITAAEHAVARAEAALAICRAPIARGAVAPFEVTAYGIGCDAGPITKSGTAPVQDHTVSADPRVLPLGSIVRISGLGKLPVRGELQVQDVGGAVKGRVLDVFLDDCDEADEWGRRVRSVEVLHIPGGAR